jgi:membrane protein YqaA with SNARE-associated domain
MFITLFITAFVSATLWPLASEVVFVSFLHQNSDALLTLLLVAGLGNTLGAILMYELAYRSSVWWQESHANKVDRLIKAKSALSKYGSVLMVMAWLPLVGDLLPIAAGALNLRRWSVYLWLAAGKFGRYAVLALATLEVLN